MSSLEYKTINKNLSKNIENFYSNIRKTTQSVDI